MFAFLANLVPGRSRPPASSRRTVPARGQSLILERPRPSVDGSGPAGQVARKRLKRRRVRVAAPPATQAKPLRLAVVSVSYGDPAAAPFASAEIKTLDELGSRVVVHDMLFAHRDAPQVLRERGIDHIPVTHLRLQSALRGLACAARMPLTTMRFIAWVTGHTYRRPGLLLRNLALVPRALEIFQDVKRAGIDVVHLYWGESPALVGRLVKWKLPDVRLSMFLGAYDLVNLQPYSPEVARDADVVWTHCRANLPRLEEIGVSPQRVKVCPRGIPIPKPETVQRVRNRIVTAGRLIPTKRMDDALAAFAVLHRNKPDATLVVLGDGPERGNLERLAAELGIRDAVEFRGHVPRAEVFREFARAQALLLMTRHPSERLPNVVKEAMAVGTVAVVTRTPGIEELVEDGVNGFIVPQGDIPGAVGRLEDVLAERGRGEIEDAARACIRQRFDVRGSMQTYFALWSQMRPPAMN